VRITMIGHSTVLIEAEGRRVLTDPYFGLWGNPAYRRLSPPALPREKLRDVDLVLLSHNHWDHVDTRFLRSLAPGTPVVAPRRSRWLTRLRGAGHVVGMRPWEERRFESLAVTAVPARHIAATIGFVVGSGEGRIYFAGDTYHGAFMGRIGERFRLEAALIPVTTFRIPMTMGEKGALQAVRDLKPRVVIPIHLGLRPRSPLLRTGHSPEGFRRRVAEAALRTEVVMLREGESWRREDREAFRDALPEPAAAAVPAG
jgi:L-ascorbate metabolism protein UlaG (beta-lactamase superfamily)